MRGQQEEAVGATGDGVVLQRIFGAIKFAFRIFSVGLLAALLLGVALLVYLFFRPWLIPESVFSEQVFFDFRSLSSCGTLGFDSTCNVKDQPLQYPRASVDLLSSRKQWQGSNLSVPAYSRPRSLSTSQQYSLLITLTLAMSQRNYDLGRCMLVGHLYDPANNLLARSARPVVIPYRSMMTRMLGVTSSWLLILLGFMREVETVRVEMFNNYQDSKTHPLSRVDLELSTTEFDIEQVYLSLLPKLNWIQYVFFHYEMFAGSVVVLSVFTLELVFLLFLTGVRWTLSLLTDAPDTGVQDRDREDTVLRSDTPGHAAIPTMRRRAAYGGAAEAKG